MKEDRRVRRTINRIEETFLSLLQTQDIDEISVSQICHEADIVRKTFYHHYADKYELLESIMDKMIDEMKEVSSEKKDLSLLEGNEHWFAFLEDKREILKVLLTNSISSYFNFKIISLLKNEIQNKERYQLNDRTSFSEDLLIEFLTSGIMGIMINFINHTNSDSRSYGLELTALLKPYLNCTANSL